MKSLKLATLALLLGLILSGCSSGKGIITVNDRPIYESEYNEMYKKAVSSPQMSYMQDKLKDKNSFFSLMMKDRIVNELIVKNIIQNEVKERNITVSNDEIKNLKNEMIQKLGGEDKFKELLKQNGISNKQLEEDLSNEISTNKLVDSVQKINVTDAECISYYNKNKKQFDLPERVRASHILIDANEDAIKRDIIEHDKLGKIGANELESLTADKMKKQLQIAQEVRAKLIANPNDFEKLAKQYSFDKQSAKRGGDLGFFTREDMVKPFSDAAFSLKVNSVSEIVQTQFGYHIILVTDRSKSGLQPYDSVKAEIKEYLTSTKKVEVLQKLFDGLKNSAKVVYVDKQYDPEIIKSQLTEIMKKQKAGLQK